MILTALFSVYKTGGMPQCRTNASSSVGIDDVIELQCSVNYSGRYYEPGFHCFTESARDGQYIAKISMMSE